MEAQTATNAFEQACGGYGYNSRGVGSLTYRYGFSADAMAAGIAPDHLGHPVETVMFADTAFAQPYGAPEYLIEYSFAEAYHFVNVDPEVGVSVSGPSQPSIHFRHRGRASTGWCDGHVSGEEAKFDSGEPFSRFDLGWIGGRDNALFDPY
jgi:prepilin-type processing-associated H-X9-DG protein